MFNNFFSIYLSHSDDKPFPLEKVRTALSYDEFYHRYADLYKLTADEKLFNLEIDIITRSGHGCIHKQSVSYELAQSRRWEATPLNQEVEDAISDFRDYHEDRKDYGDRIA